MDDFPNFYNTFTKEIVEKLGPYCYEEDAQIDAKFSECPFFGVVEIDKANQAFYAGQWWLG